MSRFVRILLLTAVMAGAAIALGAVGLVGAQQGPSPLTGTPVAELDCDSEPIVKVHTDGVYVPSGHGRSADAPGSDRAALAQFMRRNRVPGSAAGFARVGARGKDSKFALRSGGRTVATAHVEAAGDTWYVPSFTACESAAVGKGGTP